MSKKLEFDYIDRLGNRITLVPELALYEADDILTNKTRYNIAIRLYSKEEYELEPYSVLTTNLGEFIAVKDAAYIDTNNNGTQILDWLIKNDFGLETSLTKHSGFCEYPLFVFNEDMLKKIDYNGNYPKYENLYNEYYKTFEEPEEELEEELNEIDITDED